MDVVLGLAEALPSGLYSGSGHRALRAHGALRPRPHRRLPPARARALPRRHRPRHLRAHRVRRRGLGRRADLDRRARLDGAADGLQAGRDQGPRADRRRHRLDDQPRHRGRGGREVRRRRQPARARSSTTSTKQIPTLFGSRARRVSRHGLPADRLPGVQAAGLPAPARDGAAVGGALPGRRHRADRARAQRRADVPDVDHELRLARRHRPPRLRVGHAEARRGLRALPARSASATASRSRPRACARSSSTSRPRRSRRAPGARSSSRRPARCCASPPATER